MLGVTESLHDDDDDVRAKLYRYFTVSNSPAVFSTYDSPGFLGTGLGGGGLLDMIDAVARRLWKIRSRSDRSYLE